MGAAGVRVFGHGEVGMSEHRTTVWEDLAQRAALECARHLREDGDYDEKTQISFCKIIREHMREVIKRATEPRT